MSWLNLIDGMPVVYRARALTGKPVPRVAGADVIFPLLDSAADQRLRFGVLGGSADVQQALRGVLADRWPSLPVAGMWAPSREELHDESASRRLDEAIRRAEVDLLMVCRASRARSIGSTSTPRVQAFRSLWPLGVRWTCSPVESGALLGWSATQASSGCGGYALSPGDSPRGTCCRRRQPIFGCAATVDAEPVRSRRPWRDLAGTVGPLLFYHPGSSWWVFRGRENRVQDERLRRWRAQLAGQRMEALGHRRGHLEEK